MQWNIQSSLCALVCEGWWYLSLDKKSIHIHFVDTNCNFISHIGRILISCSFVAHFAFECMTEEKPPTLFEQAGMSEGMEFTTGPYTCTCITHLNEGYTSRFKVSSNISLSEMQLKKPQNTPITLRTNLFSMPHDASSIN